MKKLLNLSFVLALNMLWVSAQPLMAQAGTNQTANNCNCVGVIDFTVDQRQEIFSARKAFFADTKSVRQEIFANNRSLMQLDPAAENYQAQKQEIMAETGKLRSQIVQRRAKLDQEIKSVLNEEQQKLYDQYCSVAVCHAQNMQKAQENMEARLQRRQQMMNQGGVRGKNMQRGKMNRLRSNCPYQQNCPYLQNSGNQSDI